MEFLRAVKKAKVLGHRKTGLHGLLLSGSVLHGPVIALFHHMLWVKAEPWIEQVLSLQVYTAMVPVPQHTCPLLFLQ